MKKTKLCLSASIISIVLIFSLARSANAIIIGGSVSSGNQQPFGFCENPPWLCDRYQQVYDAGQFTDPFEISAIGFFLFTPPGFGNFNIGTYNFELSVTSKNVDALDTTNLENNVTGTAHTFATSVFTDVPATDFQISGTPFLYDPSAGNLLLDIKIPGGATHSNLSFGAMFKSHNGDAGGIYSRASNFGTGFERYGLVTEFIGVYVPEPYAIDIDIKPQSCPNPLNVKSQGLLPVAILGTDDLDVGNIDVATLEIDGVAPKRSRIEDVETANGFEPCDCLALSGDGTDDLVLKFITQEIVDILPAVQNGDIIQLTLTGQLTDGTAFEGIDCVVIRGVK